MSTPLEAYNGVIKSNVGAAYPGSHAIFRGHNLHTELNHMSWFELYVFGITGRCFTTEQLQLLEAIWTYTSYPDVRLWNNRVAGLAGSSRSTGNLGVAAALAVSEASIYGRGIDKRAIDFLIRTHKQVESGADLLSCIQQELAQHRSIAGYGRPITNGDERNPYILALAKKLKLDQGPYLQFAFTVENALLTGRWRMNMNYAAVVAALGADMGMTTQEFYLFMFPTFLSGMLPCFIEATTNKEGTLYTTACTNCCLYEGPSKRTWHAN